MTLSRRHLLSLSTLSALASGCGFWRIDPWHPFLRSEYIHTPEQELEVLSRCSTHQTSDGRVRVLKVNGSPYEMGYQQGALLREEVRESLLSMWDNVLDVYYFEEFFDEAYEQLRPFIPQAYVDEMHGLAHGAKLPLRVIHALHALPEMSEWGGKKRIRKLIKEMMAGELVTSCSNLSAQPEATADGKMLTVRILDWGLYKISKLNEYPQITEYNPPGGLRYANVGWSGFIGAVSGMNEAGITLGEMGYGDPEGEVLRGVPMVFLLREVLAHSRNLDDVRRILREAKGNNSYVFLMSDGKTNEAALFIKDKNRLEEYLPGQPITDHGETLPPIPNIVYGGHYRDRMTKTLTEERGHLTPEGLMNSIIPNLAMKGNFHNVIYRPADLHLWVANAKSEEYPAFTQPYSFFDLKAALAGEG